MSMCPQCSNDPSDCAGHAVAVLSQRSSVTGRNDCSSGSFAPLTFCGLPPGLAGSQLLDASQMRWSSAGSGTEARHAKSPTKIDENRVARFRAPPPDAKRPSRVIPCQKSAIRCFSPAVASCLKSVTNSKCLEQLAREVAGVQGRPAGKQEDIIRRGSCTETALESRHWRLCADL